MKVRRSGSRGYGCVKGKPYRTMELITGAASSAYCRRVGQLLAFASLLGWGVLTCSESNSGGGKPLGAQAERLEVAAEAAAATAAIQ
jgi:hypothetical protein